MRVKRFTAACRAACCAMLLAATWIATAPPPIAEARETANPPLWRLADRDNEVWLLGAVHMLPETLDWYTPKIDAAFDAAEIVYFEVPLESSDGAEMRSLVAGLGTQRWGPTLSERLSREGRERLAQAAEKIGHQASGYERLRPWLAFISLEIGFMNAAGASAEAGVDAVISTRARAVGKTIRYLEKPTQQIRIFSDMPDDEMIVLLEQALESYQERPSISRELLDAWARGDDRALAALVFEGRDLFPSYFDALFDMRNEAWLADVEAALDGDQDVLFVVGAGHLIGAAGVPSLLRARGFEVERR